jgi:hypothetical protein
LSSDHVQITRSGVQAAGPGQALDEAVLRDGAQVVLRVLSAPANGGRGLVSLAGRCIAADLPAGLHGGQRLAVRVEADGPERVLLRILRDGPTGDPDPAARLAGQLLLTGDPELVRAALLLTGSVPLPGGGAAEVEVDPDADDAGGGTGILHARVTLHLPELGAVEIALALGPAGIGADVVVEPGRPARVAGEAADELCEALARAAGVPATVAVEARRPGDRRPAPPPSLPRLDVHA